MKSKLNTAPLMRVLSAFFFVAFTFSYLYFYQADVMAATQHLLSGGQTHYDRTIGALLVTLALYLLHLGVLAVTKLTRRAHAITYFPSLLCLCVLTSIRIHPDLTFDFGIMQWLLVVLLVVFCFVAYFFRKVSIFEEKIKPRYSPIRLLWANLLTLAVMFLLVGLCSNHDDAMHYRLRAESCLMARDYDGALNVGKQSLVCDSNLTMLRIQALARKRQLGERLFEYPLCGGSSVMMPNGKNIRPILCPEYRFIRYPELDYQLCQYLLDKKLDAFAQVLKANGARYGLEPTPAKTSQKTSAPAETDSVPVQQPLPKHYAEALVMYTRMRAQPVIDYHHDVISADYEDFLKILRGESDPRKRNTRLRDVYGNTYWYYYVSNR